MAELMVNRGWKYSVRGGCHSMWTLPPRSWHPSKPERPLSKLPFYLLQLLSLAGHKIRGEATTLLCELTLGAFGFLPAFPAVSFTPKNLLGPLRPGSQLSIGRSSFSFLKYCRFIFFFLIRPRVTWLLFIFFSYESEVLESFSQAAKGRTGIVLGFLAKEFKNTIQCFFFIWFYF